MLIQEYIFCPSFIEHRISLRVFVVFSHLPDVSLTPTVEVTPSAVSGTCKFYFHHDLSVRPKYKVGKVHFYDIQLSLYEFEFFRLVRNTFRFDVKAWSKLGYHRVIQKALDLFLVIWINFSTFGPLNEFFPSCQNHVVVITHDRIPYKMLWNIVENTEARSEGHHKSVQLANGQHCHSVHHTVNPPARQRSTQPAEQQQISATLLPPPWQE